MSVDSPGSTAKLYKNHDGSSLSFTSFKSPTRIALFPSCSQYSVLLWLLPMSFRISKDTRLMPGKWLSAATPDNSRRVGIKSIIWPTPSVNSPGCLIPCGQYQIDGVAMPPSCMYFLYFLKGVFDA